MPCENGGQSKKFCIGEPKLAGHALHLCAKVRAE